MDLKKPLTFEEFSKSGLELWKSQALKELKKEDLESLRWKNKDDILLDPYYDASNSSANKDFHHLINKENNYAADARWWENRQQINIEALGTPNKSILEALAGGADGIILEGFSNSGNLLSILEDVVPKYCSISFISNNLYDFKSLLTYINHKEIKSQVKGEIYWSSFDALNDLLKEDFEGLPAEIRCFGFVPEKEKNEDEIVNHLLNTKKIVDQLEEEQKENIVSRMSWQLSVTEDYFQSIASIKVLRQLLFQLFSAYDIKINPKDIFIYANSPVYQNEKYGPHENMLKGTTAAMAGIIGGCNALYVQPADSSSLLQQRIARNISLILKEEAHLSKNIDPAAGSYFLESLIEKTAKMKWQKFQELV